MADFCQLLGGTLLLIALSAVEAEIDLLDTLQTKAENPPELNDFLSNVLKHKDDFGWIRKASKFYNYKQRNRNQVDDEVVREKSSLSKNTEETRPINDIYPHVYDAEIMERRSPYGRFQNEMDYYNKRLKRSNNKNLVIEKEPENENINPRKFEKQISVVSHSNIGVLRVPGKKCASNLQKKCVEEDELHETITTNNTNTTGAQMLLNTTQGDGNSEYFFISPHDILGLDQDIAGENEDKNETCILNDVHKVRVRSQNAAGDVSTKPLTLKQLEKSTVDSSWRQRSKLKRGQMFYNKTHINPLNSPIRDMQKLYEFMMNSPNQEKNFSREALLQKNDDNILQNIDRMLKYDRYALNSVHAFNKDFPIMHNDDQSAFDESLNDPIKLKTRDDKESSSDAEKYKLQETNQNSHGENYNTLHLLKPNKVTFIAPLRQKWSRDIKDSQIKYIVDEENEQFYPTLRQHNYRLRKLDREGAKRMPKKKHVAMDLNRLRFEIESNPANYFKKSRNMLQNNINKGKLTVDQFPLRTHDTIMINDYDDSQQQEGTSPKYENQQKHKTDLKMHYDDTFDEQKKKIIKKLREDLLNKNEDKRYRGNSKQNIIKLNDAVIEEPEVAKNNAADSSDNVNVPYNSKQPILKPQQIDQSPELEQTLNEYQSRQNEYDLKKTDEEDEDVSPDNTLVQDKKNLLEDQTEPTSAAEQKELGKNNETYVTDIDITQIEFPAVLPVKKSSFPNAASKEIETIGFKVKESKDVIHMSNPKKIQEISSYWKQKVEGEDETKVRERQNVVDDNKKDKAKFLPNSVLYRTRKLNSFSYETPNEEDDDNDSKNSWENEYYDEKIPLSEHVTDNRLIRVNQRSEDDESDEDTGNDLKTPRDFEKQATKLNDTEGTNKEDFESTFHFPSNVSNDTSRDTENTCVDNNGIISTTINYYNSNITMIVSYKNNTKFAPDDDEEKVLKNNGKASTHLQTDTDASTDSSIDKELDADEEIDQNDDFHDRTSTSATGKSVLENVKLIFGKKDHAGEKNDTRKLGCKTFSKETTSHYDDESRMEGVHHHKDTRKQKLPNVPRDECCAGYSQKSNKKYVVGRDMPESLNTPIREVYNEEESMAEPLKERLLLEKVYNSVIKKRGKIDKKHIEDYINNVDINDDLDEHVHFDESRISSKLRIGKKQHVDEAKSKGKKPIKQTGHFTKHNKNLSRKVRKTKRKHKTRSLKSSKKEILNKVEHFKDIVENNVKVQKRNLQNNRGGSLEDVPDFYLSPMLERSEDEKHREKRRLKYLTRRKKENVDSVQEKSRNQRQHEFMVSNNVNERPQIHDRISNRSNLNNFLTATPKSKFVTNSLNFTSNKQKNFPKGGRVENNQDAEAAYLEKKQEKTDMKQMLSGKLPVKILLDFFSKIKQIDVLYKRFGKDLNYSKEKSLQDVNEIKQFRLEQSKINVGEAEKMLHGVIVLLNEIVDDQVHRKTCLQLSPNLKLFIFMITKSARNMNKNDHLAEGLPLPKLRGTNDNQIENPPIDVDQGEYLFHNPHPNNKQNERDNINKKIHLVRKLLKKYENMSSKCQVQVESVRDYLLKHLGMLMKLREETRELTKCTAKVDDAKSSSENNLTNSEYDVSSTDVQQTTCAIDSDLKYETQSTTASMESHAGMENTKLENSKAYESVDKKQNSSQNSLETEVPTQIKPFDVKLGAQNGAKSDLLERKNKEDFSNSPLINNQSIQSNKTQQYQEKTLTEQQHSHDSLPAQYNKDVSNDTSRNEQFEKNMETETQTNHEIETTLKEHGVFEGQLETKSFTMQNDATSLNETWGNINVVAQNKSTENYKSQEVCESQTKNQVEIFQVTTTSIDTKDKVLQENSSSVTIATIESKINDQGNLSKPNIVPRGSLDLDLGDSRNFLPKFDTHGTYKDDLIKSELNAAKSFNKDTEASEEKGFEAPKHERSRWSKDTIESLMNDDNVMDKYSKLYGKEIQPVGSDLGNNQEVSKRKGQNVFSPYKRQCNISKIKTNKTDYKTYGKNQFIEQPLLVNPTNVPDLSIEKTEKQTGHKYSNPELVNKNLVSLGLDGVNSYIVPLNIKEIIQTQMKADKEHKNPVFKIMRPGTLHHKREVGNVDDRTQWKVSDKYKKLLEAVTNAREKRQNEEMIGRLYGRSLQEKNDKFARLKATNEAEEISKLEFERPVVFTL